MRAAWLLGMAVGCGGAPAAVTPPGVEARGGLHVFAEGPCPKLSAQRWGDAMVLVYGDTGYDLHGWTPGEPVAAAQSVAEITGDRVMRRPALLRGLPIDDRGYVRGDLSLGGEGADRWLLRSRVRYARGGTGALFETEEDGYRWAGDGWVGAEAAVTRPAQARRLPAWPDPICAGDFAFVPIAHASSPEGGVLVAGRCDDAAAPNPVDPIVMVVHGRAGASQWSVTRVPETDELRGIVNLDLHVRSDDEAFLVAYEPFVPRANRQAFLAGFDGKRWRRIAVEIDDGLMSVTGDATQLFLAAGRRLYRWRDGSSEAMPLPLPALAEVTADQMHIHRARVWGSQLWVEANYRVRIPREGGRYGEMVASALYRQRPPRRPVYCDVREPADVALAEVGP